jgi:hypothetical protein
MNYLHALTSMKQFFQWGGKKTNSFETLKEKISTAPIFPLPYLQQLFEIQPDGSRYAMGAVLMQQGKPICYHYKIFTQVVINYTTYEKELYALVHSVNKWNHYLMAKETMKV